MLPKASQNSQPSLVLLQRTFGYVEGCPQGLGTKWGQSPSSAAPQGLSSCQLVTQQPTATGQTCAQDRRLRILARYVRASPFPTESSQKPPYTGEKPDALQGFISSCSFKRIFSLEGAALLIAEMTDISTNQARNPALTPSRGGRGEGQAWGSPHSADSILPFFYHSGYHQPCH